MIMKTKRKIIARLLITMMFSMLITGIFAQNPDALTPPVKANCGKTSPPDAPLPPPPPPPPPAPPAPPAPADMDNRDAPGIPQLDLPGLTIEQREKIRLSGLEHMKAMTPLFNQVREKKARLQTILATTPFDVKSADQVAEDLGKMETVILKELIRHDQALRNLLTPEQQVVFDARPKPFLQRKR